MRLPGPVAPRDLGALVFSFTETKSVRETFVGETEVGREAASSTLVLGGE